MLFSHDVEVFGFCFEDMEVAVRGSLTRLVGGVVGTAGGSAADIVDEADVMTWRTVWRDFRCGLRNDDKSSENGSPIMIELLPQVTVALNLHAGLSAYTLRYFVRGARPIR